jgi:hypothetical protein
MVHRNPTSHWLAPARWLGVGIIAALILAGSGGCKVRDRSRPQAGGATSRKAQEARKQAEDYAVDAVQGAALAQVAAHPELDRRNGLTRFMARINSMTEPTVTVSAASAESPPAPPGPTPAGKAVRPVTRPVVAEATAASGDRGPPTLRRATGRVVIREHIVTEIPYPSEAEADDRTLDKAAEIISQKLLELDPPVEYLPSRAVVRNEYSVPSSRRVRQPPEQEASEYKKIDGKDRVYVEYTVERTADQIRELRTRDRVGDAFRLIGIMSAVSLAGFLFLRLDEWTKGYLTSWLVFVAVALAGGVVAALILV